MTDKRTADERRIEELEAALRQSIRRLLDAEEAVVLMYEHLDTPDHAADCHECDTIFVEAGNKWGECRSPNDARVAFEGTARKALGEVTQ